MLALLAAAAMGSARPAPTASIKAYRGPPRPLAPRPMGYAPQGRIQTFSDPALPYRKDGKAKAVEPADLPRPATKRPSPAPSALRQSAGRAVRRRTLAAVRPGGAPRRRR